MTLSISTERAHAVLGEIERADLLENLGAQSDLLAVRAAVLVHDGGTVGGDGEEAGIGDG